MAAVAALPNLDEAIEIANKLLALEKRNLTVTYKNKPEDPKQPIPIQMKMPDGKIREIGIIHLVRLEGKDWDAKPFEALARTTEQVANVIIERVNLTINLSNHKGNYFSSNGTIFEFNEFATVSVEGILLVGEKPVTWKGNPLNIAKIQSEGKIIFVPGCIYPDKRTDLELFDSWDQRDGKGMYINEKNELYRA